MSLLDQAKKLPLSPGVYLFLDTNGEVLYVGRATSLRKRVSSYFQKILEPRLREMIAQAKRIKYYETDTLLQAIILEANLIKKYWPKYNIRERDSRSFVFIVIPRTDYPEPLIMRGKELAKFLGMPQSSMKNPEQYLEFLAKKEKNFYIFGPYQSLDLVQNFLRVIRRIFPYSTCTPFSGKPCFDYQIGLCPGLCIGAISKKDYQKNIKNLVLLLSGQKEKLIKKLAKENPEKSKALQHIQDVALFNQKNWEEEKIGLDFTFIPRVEGYDISHLYGKETYGSMVVFQNGEPKFSDYRLFKVKEAPKNDDLRALAEVISRRFRHSEWPFPNLILIDGGKPQVDYVTKILKQLKINIPVVGISKYANDQLVFPQGVRKSSKKFISSLKNLLLKVREEAHRFAHKASKNKRLKSNFH